MSRRIWSQLWVTGILPSPEESLSNSSSQFAALDVTEAALTLSAGRLPLELTSAVGTTLVDLTASAGRVAADAPVTRLADGIGSLFEVDIKP
jgi:hypothetical protein